ncbi:hypothetical protein [Stenomitos frigidus]|uniref:hypothetical protein n=1 Tax=Stenomitos frigidus TaxID=1886765 RepID=UPI0015E7929B|nr:hypothetical protein [Stenomitos frigidus]
MTQKTIKTKTKSLETDTQSKELSTPNPSLKSLERLVGKWKATDPSGSEAIDGATTFE